MKQKKNSNPEFDFADSFFREVSEELHNDNMKALWKKYGVHIVAGVIIVLTIAVSFETIKHWKERANQNWSDAFAYAQMLQNQGKFEESIIQLQSIAAKGNDIYADEAAIKIANILFEQGKNDEAVKALEEFIAKANNEQLRNASIMKLATYKIDTLSTADLRTLLHPVLEPDSAWINEANELIALSYLKHNNTQEATKIYQDMAARNDLNDNLRARVQNMISVLNSAN